jgi:transcriptional regulator with XRE-family HTH domain
MGRRALADVDRSRAARLREALETGREARRLSINDLAVDSGVHYETVRAVLGGKSAGPCFFIVADLARALGLSLDELARQSGR